LSSPAERGTREGKGTQVDQLCEQSDDFARYSFEHRNCFNTWVPFPSLCSAGDDNDFWLAILSEEAF